MRTGNTLKKRLTLHQKFLQIPRYAIFNAPYIILMLTHIEFPLYTNRIPHDIVYAMLRIVHH